MYRYAIFIMLISMQIGLFISRPSAPRDGINPDVKIYVDRFVQYGKKYRGEAFELRPINVDIGAVKSIGDPFLEPETVGWCKPYLHPPQIILDSDYWSGITDLEKEQLVMHELSHCVLELDHDESLDENGDPISLMHPYVIKEAIYKKHREEYIKRIFNTKPTVDLSF